MALDLYQLNTFYRVAKTLNYTRAAAVLCLSPSAVSHAMRKLEKSCGYTLVHKTGNQLALTQNGQILFRACESIFQEIACAENAMAVTMHQPAGTIQLGTTVEFGISVLIRYMKPFYDLYPNIHIDLSCHNTLINLLLNDELDMMIDCKPHDHPCLTRTLLFREKYVIIASPDYLNKHPIRTAGDLEHVTILSLDHTAQWWENFLNTFPPGERPVFHTIRQINHIRGMINATQLGLGVAFVPKYSVTEPLKTRALINVLPDLALLEDTFCIYMKRQKADYKRHLVLQDFLLQIRPEEFN